MVVHCINGTYIAGPADLVQQLAKLLIYRVWYVLLEAHEFKSHKGHYYCRQIDFVITPIYHACYNIDVAATSIPEHLRREWNQSRYAILYLKGELNGQSDSINLRNYAIY
jgi:hypothetical protein